MKPALLTDALQTGDRDGDPRLTTRLGGMKSLGFELSAHARRRQKAGAKAA